MPIYEYRCQKCHHHFEEIQKVVDAPVASCPKCHGKVSRLISQTRFSLKGEGWYKDGYSKPAPKKEASKETRPAESKGDDGKPATPPTSPTTPPTKGS